MTEDEFIGTKVDGRRKSKKKKKKLIINILIYTPVITQPDEFQQ